MVWKYLAHPNIVSLVGVTTDPLQLISDWMVGGNLMEYAANNPNVDGLSLVSVPSTLSRGELIPSSVIRCR